MKEIHTPVFAEEALECLRPISGKRYIDATADGGGHAVRIIRAIQPAGKLLAIEWDETLFPHLEARLKKECSSFSKNYVLRRASYVELASVIRSLAFGPVAGALFDLGLSSFHLEGSRRGFSFRGDEPLDMRYSPSDLNVTAADLLARSHPDDLEAMIGGFGGERFARRIVRAVIAERVRRPIRKTQELIEIIRRALPVRYHRSRIHFATRTFQALRIAVNHELENIPKGLAAAADALEIGGRVAVITFHDREASTVRDFFRRREIRPQFVPLFAKPLSPAPGELRANRRARSARLYAFERVA